MDITQAFRMESTLSGKTYDRFRELVYERAGIHLGANKQALLSARLRKRMRVLKMETFAEYYEHVRDDATGEEIVQLLDAVSTNVTQFYREARHFDVFAEALAKWQEQGRKRIRIWCAAASSGEEPYTLAITMRESLSAEIDAKILATDISTRVLEMARRGHYDESKLTNVPRPLLTRYFRRYGNRSSTIREVSPDLRAMVTFGRLNLATPPFPMHGPLDAVFCRNVMIYFDNAVRQRLVTEVERLLAPDGLLFIGHSETLTGIKTRLVANSPSVYRFR
jgi:chemotaxis protein methyltransferase CheR